MSEKKRESWRINFNLECQDEQEAESIFNAFQAYLEEVNFTHWSSKMFRDLKMEQALKTFRENKEEILAGLPQEVVEHYMGLPDYPDRKVERHLSIVPELEKDNGEAIDKNAS